jgi:hypothetical protein
MDTGDRIRIAAFVGELPGEHDDHAAFGDTESSALRVAQRSFSFFRNASASTP